MQILIEGNEVDTLSGHLALWLPLGADLSLVESSRSTIPVSRGARTRSGDDAPGARTP